MRLDFHLQKAMSAVGRVLIGAYPEPRKNMPLGAHGVGKIGFALLALAAAAAACAGFAGASHGVSSIFFLPALLIITLASGWWLGVAAWIVATLSVWYLLARAGISEAVYDAVAFSIASGLLVVLSAFAHSMLFDLERVRRRLSLLMDASRGFIFVADGKGRPLEPTPGWTSVTGMAWNEYQNEGWMNAIHPDDRSSIQIHESPDEGSAYHAELRLREARGDWRWHRMTAIPIAGRDGKVAQWIGSMHDIHEQKGKSQHRELVLSEARHRLKNLMAIVETLAKYSAPRAGTDPAVDAFLKRYTGRLHALTAASDAVLTGRPGMIEAGTVIRATLAPFMGDPVPRILLDGPELELPEDFGGSLAMAVHELATNAIKYGALCRPDGTVSLIWASEKSDGDERVQFEWKEHGGPAPQSPVTEGFGSRMIRSVTARERSGGVTIDYEPDGLRCRIFFMRRPPSDAGVSLA